MKSKSIPKHFLLILYSLTVLSWLILSEAHPLENKEGKDSFADSLGFPDDELPKVQIKQGEKPALTRNKRTVGFLRQLFPGISQIIDRKIQQITRILFRVVGRLILRGGGGNSDGNSGSGDNGGNGGRKISITLPTYPPIEDEEDETNAPVTDGELLSSSSPSPTSTEAPPDIDTRIGGSEPLPVQANSSSTNSGTSSATNSASPSNDSSPTTDNMSESSNTIVRKSRDVADVLLDSTLLPELDANSSSSTPTESTTPKRIGFLARFRDMRNKRGSNGAGTGNFIFDLVRLIAGSGVTPEKDEEQNAPREERDDDSASADVVNEVSDSGTSSYNPEEDTSGIPASRPNQRKNSQLQSETHHRDNLNFTYPSRKAVSIGPDHGYDNEQGTSAIKQSKLHSKN